MSKLIVNFLLILLFISGPLLSQWYIPASYSDITEISNIKLTAIGHFGLLRKERPNVPAHYHTGIDIVRPKPNYYHEPIFPSLSGEVVSIIDDGPFSQIIVKHFYNGRNYWSVYEHLHVKLRNIGITVNPYDTLGYFFNIDELNRYGWQFDHFHFEINKIEPQLIKPTAKNPKRVYRTFAINCYTKEELDQRLENPLEFLRGRISGR
jgi:murein DD-endopeptidase MepM/ murein hydrolase activator NlpD